MDSESSDEERSAHESMRSSMKDRTSWPWSPEPAVCLFWLGPTPSGTVEVVKLRRKLRRLLCGPGFHQEFMDGMQLIAPAILHAKWEFNPTPDTVYDLWRYGCVHN